MTRVAAVAAAAAAVAAAGAAHGAPLGTLPSPTERIREEPPLAARQAAGGEQRILGRLGMRELVRVGVDQRGRPVRVTVLDRVTVSTKGDYTFAIAGPIDDVAAAPGSRSAPGLRPGAVLWQGFSPGRRMLAALVALDPAHSAAALPLRVDIRTTGSRTELRLRNATTTSAEAVDAPAPAAAVARAVQAARASLERNQPLTTQAIELSGPLRTRRVSVVAPLKVTGTATFAGRPRSIDVALGRRNVWIRANGRLTGLRLGVVLPSPARLLEGRPTTMLTASKALLTAALARQYRAFLGNPDPAGSTTTAYVFSLAPAARPAAAPASGDHPVWPWIATGLALAVAAAGAVVLWAHS
jgi:hypothetical protein